MFLCSPSKNPKPIVDEIRYEDILAFLTKYKNTYNFGVTAKVYFKKLKYLIKAIYFKIFGK
jgi:hypothetical protein